jgi:hypothetical protein
MKPPVTHFIHYIGDCRFKRAIYAKLANFEIIKLISEATQILLP